jgi:hypothetical protein
MGEATHEPGGEESFVDLVERADAMMYERKRQRAAVREAVISGDIGGDTAIDHSVTGVMTAYAPRNDLR